MYKIMYRVNETMRRHMSAVVYSEEAGKMVEAHFPTPEEATAAARRRYDHGEPVQIVPCKCNPASVWFTGFEMVKQNQTFDQFVNAFSYYNCCPELGTRPAFYVAE